MMKSYFYTAGILLFLIPAACNRETVPPPNILFIFADDHSLDAVGALGNMEIQTPAIDELAGRGVLFSGTYNMGGWNGAICIASRTMLNTGRYLWNAREAEQVLDSLAGEGMFWSSALADLGYETYFTGKWHVNCDPAEIFRHVGTVRPGMPGDSPRGYHRPRDENDTDWVPWDSAFGGYWEGGVHWSEATAREAAGFLEEAARSENPFFMYVAFNAPHDPRQSPRGFVERYPVDSIMVPENYMPLYPFREEMGCGPSLRDEALAPFPRTPYAVRVHRQEYYALITHLDTQVGFILDQLVRSGLDENTIVIYAADHGLAVGHHGLIGKQNMYQHSLCPPMIIAGPGIPAGAVIDAAVYLQDIVPTTLELAGGGVPPYMEFQSLLPLLAGGDSASPHERIYGAYTDRQRMIRRGNYKLIAYPAAGVVRLFHLGKDPLEMDDLAGEPDQQDRVRDLYGELRLLMEEMGDTLTLPPLG